MYCITFVFLIHVLHTHFNTCIKHVFFIHYFHIYSTIRYLNTKICMGGVGFHPQLIQCRSVVVNFRVNTGLTRLLIKEGVLYLYICRVRCLWIPNVQGMEKIQGGKPDIDFPPLTLAPIKRLWIPTQVEAIFASSSRKKIAQCSQMYRTA